MTSLLIWMTAFSAIGAAFHYAPDMMAGAVLMAAAIFLFVGLLGDG